VLDVAIASIGFTASAIIYPIIILAIKLDSRGPAFITQKRVGQNNKIFSNLKFRSMLVNDGGKWPEKNDKRITKVGKFLRKTRLDELPQLINVIRGDISLVGPRPDIIDLYEKLESEIPYYKIRNLIKPGLTGWAQIHQESPPHSVESTKQRLSYDFYYLKNKSLILDLMIILRTIKTLLSQKGS
jgi:lipopolysaccharide/colanic/teichoic acid biosynthesis glycosyltransferase